MRFRLTSPSPEQNRAANCIPRPARAFLLLASRTLVVSVFAALISFVPNSLLALQNGSGPVVVQPGAPGQPTRKLPASTHGKLPPLSHNDVEFMQGMIMHHAQAVEMTALIPSHTENPELRTLGARISHSQSDEINFMKRWLAARGQPASMHPGTPQSAPPDAPAQMTGMNHAHHASHSMLMPGMLTPEQMDALRKARGADFDHLFLTGMIQHHGGALTMVHDLFNSAGSGQDAELFNFATDVDSGQRAEIRIMQAMLEQKAPQEKQ